MEGTRYPSALPARTSGSSALWRGPKGGQEWLTPQGGNRRDGLLGSTVLLLRGRGRVEARRVGMGLIKGDVLSEQSPARQTARVDRGSGSARTSARRGTPGPWRRRASHPTPKHTQNAYQTQGLGSYCWLLGSDWPKVTVMVISGASPGTQARALLHALPGRQTRNDSLPLICMRICIVSLTSFHQGSTSHSRNWATPTQHS